MRTAVTQATIAVFGAGGHTGAFVVAELMARGFTSVAVGRDTRRLAAATARTAGIVLREASVDAPASLDRAFAGVAAVINCAGPFLDTADAVAASALRMGAHYFDVTAEQASVFTTLERHDAAARDAGVVVVPGMGFYGGLADLLLTALIDNEQATDVTVAIALDSWHPTRGTRLTGARNTVPRVVIRGGQLVPLPQPAPRTTWTFPAPFGRQEMTAVPLSEVPLIAHHLPVASLTSLLNDAPLRDLHDPGTPPPQAADDTGRSAQRFLVDIEARTNSATKRATAAGRDIYAVTAPLVVGAVEQVLSASLNRGGAFAPGEILDAGRLLDALSPAHLQFAFSSLRTDLA